MTVLEDDPNLPGILRVRVNGGGYFGKEIRALNEWVLAEAEGYPRPTIEVDWLDFKALVTLPYAKLSDEGSGLFHFDRATQDNLAVLFRMRWS